MAFVGRAKSLFDGDERVAETDSVGNGRFEPVAQELAQTLGGGWPLAVEKLAESFVILDFAGSPDEEGLKVRGDAGTEKVMGVEHIVEVVRVFRRISAAIAQARHDRVNVRPF